MNATIHAADRATHIRIVAMALIAAIAVTGFAASIRFNSIVGMQANANASRSLKARASGDAACPQIRLCNAFEHG